MSIVANFDINVRGNTEGIDKATVRTSDKIAEMRKKVTEHGAAMGEKIAEVHKKVKEHGSAMGESFKEVGSRIKEAFNSLPGAELFTAILTPAVHLAKDIGSRFEEGSKKIGEAGKALLGLGAASSTAEKQVHGVAKDAAGRIAAHLHGRKGHGAAKGGLAAPHQAFGGNLQKSLAAMPKQLQKVNASLANILRSMHGLPPLASKAAKSFGSMKTALGQANQKASALGKTGKQQIGSLNSQFGKTGAAIHRAFAGLPSVGGKIASTMRAGGLATKAMAGGFRLLPGGINSASTAMAGFGATTTAATGGLNLIMGAMAAVGAAAVGAGAAWVSMGMESMEGIKQAHKAADKLGFSVETIQGLAFKGKTDIESVTNSLFKMERAIGAEGHNNVFAKLKLSQDELKAAKPEEAFKQIATALDKVDSKTEKAALAAGIWGRNSQQALRLIGGGAEGIAASLAKAKGLGDIASGGEAQQVKEAAEAVKDMKFALSGLGKTAAIAISPFVKMIAEGVTKAMQWLNQFREKIIDFSINLEFVFRNIPEYVNLYFDKALWKIVSWANDLESIFNEAVPAAIGGLSGLLGPTMDHLTDVIAHALVKIGNLFVHTFTEVIPEVLKNWQDLLKASLVLDPQAIANIVSAINAKMSERLEGDIERILREDAERSGKAMGTAMDKALSNAGQKIKESLNRGEGPIEEQLRKQFEAEQKALEARRQKFFADKKKALGMHGEEAEGSKKETGGGMKENAAVQRGSVEAFKIIAGAQSDKMYKVANEQLAELRKIAKEAKKNQRRRGTIIEVGRI